MSALDGIIGEIYKELATMKAAMARTFTEGTVAAVDPARQRARIQVGQGEDGTPVLGPWVPYSQMAGAFKGHVPVSVGQQMTMIAPNGDWSRAALIPMTFSDENKSPGSGADNAWTFGSVRVDLSGDTVTVTSPTVKVVAEKAIIEAGAVALGGEDGKPVARIGDHVHVKSGSSAGLWPIVEGSSVVSAVD